MGFFNLTPASTRPLDLDRVMGTSSSWTMMSLTAEPVLPFLQKLFAQQQSCNFLNTTEGIAKAQKLAVMMIVLTEIVQGGRTSST